MDSPYTKYRQTQYRGPSTSEEYNARIQENHADLTVLYNRARLSEIEIHELYSRMVKEQLSITRVIGDLEQRVQNIEDEQRRLTFFSADQLDNDRFPGTEYEVHPYDALTYDQVHGLLTLPSVDTSSLSKLYYVNVDHEEVVPAGTESRIQGNPITADRPGAKIDESPIEYALYKKPGLIWERNVIVDSPNINGAELDVYMKVPTDLFTTDSANSLVLHPFPFFGSSVKEISYTTRVNPSLDASDDYAPLNSDALYSGENDAIGWVPPGGWTGVNKGRDHIRNCGPKNFIFPPKAITAIKIRLHQDKYYEEGGKYIYSYGLSRIDLRYTKFQPEGRALIRFDAPDGETINSIIGLYPQVWNLPADKIITSMDFEIVWESASGSLPTKEQQTNSRSVWIDLKLTGTPGWSPALSGLIVDYVAGSPL